MMKSKLNFALAAWCALALGVGAAKADSIPLSIDFNSLVGGVGLDLYTRNADFTLPVGFTNASLDIVKFTVDDRGVLVLNDVIVASVGINGPGSGQMVLTDGTIINPFPFQYANPNVGPFAAITGPFKEGLNTLQVIVNNTGTGISGTLTYKFADQRDSKR